MPFTRRKQTIRVSLITAFLVMSFSKIGYSQNLDSGEAHSFQKLAYIGIGGGSSDLEPLTTDGTPVEFTGREERYRQAFLGRDFSSRISAELHFHDLGENQSDSGVISYEDITLTGLLYLRHRDRNGLAFYGRFGAGDIKTTSDTPIQREHDINPVAGLGIEYAGQNGFAVRTEYWYHDEDASNISLALLYRFDSQANVIDLASPASQASNTFEAPNEEAKQDFSVLPPLPTSESNEFQPNSNTFTLDNNQLTKTSWCSDSQEFTFTESGCKLTANSLQQLTFPEGSVLLTEEAQRTLDNIARLLLIQKEVSFELRAHTDNGAESMRYSELSSKRARAVALFFTSKGISLERMSARAYDGSYPIATNETAEGRRTNRRVEIITTPTQ